MIVAIHQPQYMPYIGYIQKILKSDIFVFLDDAQYKKNEWQNRNRIKSSNGVIWITVPVKYKFGQKINEVVIADDYWRKKHIQAIRLNYAKSDYFNSFFPVVEGFLNRSYEKISDLNIDCVKMILNYMKIEKKLILSSSLDISTVKTQRLIDICKKLNADTYLSGDGGRDYLDEKKFHENNINLIYQNYRPPVYKQLYVDFVPNLSIIDMLFNIGPDKTKELLSV